MPAWPKPGVDGASEDHGGVATVEEWGLLAARVTRAMHKEGAELAEVLAPLGLHPARYWRAAEYWNARMAADPSVAHRFNEIMVRENRSLMEAHAKAHADAHREPSTWMKPDPQCPGKASGRPRKPTR
jgi:hypothetical protein